MSRWTTRSSPNEVNVERFMVLFDHSYWARDRLFAAMRDISADDYSRQTGLTLGSLRAVLAHCLDTEYLWRRRLEGHESNGITEVDTATPMLLQERWLLEEAAMRAYLVTLTDADLDSDLIWLGAAGTERRLPNRWVTLAHMLNHSTQHRSEAAEALTRLGRSPGDLDLGLYAREHPGLGRTNGG